MQYRTLFRVILNINFQNQVLFLLLVSVFVGAQSGRYTFDDPDSPEECTTITTDAGGDPNRFNLMECEGWVIRSSDSRSVTYCREKNAVNSCYHSEASEPLMETPKLFTDGGYEVDAFQVKYSKTNYELSFVTLKYYTYVGMGVSLDGLSIRKNNLNAVVSGEYTSFRRPGSFEPDQIVTFKDSVNIKDWNINTIRLGLNQILIGYQGETISAKAVIGAWTSVSIFGDGACATYPESASNSVIDYSDCELETFKYFRRGAFAEFDFNYGIKDGSGIAIAVGVESIGYSSGMFTFEKSIKNEDGQANLNIPTTTNLYLKLSWRGIQKLNKLLVIF